MNDADNSIDRRARATKFGQVTVYSTALTVKTFDKFGPGIYKIAAENAEVYVTDGQPSSFSSSEWSRIEAGDFELWECRASGEMLSVYLSTGATVRITQRCAG